MAVEYSLDQRLYRLNMTKKDLFEICKARGLKISLNAINNLVSNQDEAKYDMPSKFDKVKQVLYDIETKRGIKDVYFDRR